MNRRENNNIESKLWQSFKSGDRDSFATVYVENVEALFNYGRQIVNNQDLVEDVIQDLFVDLWQGREKLTNVNSVRAYLLKSLRYKLIKERKKGLQLLSDDRSAFLLDFSIESKLIIEEGNREILECLKENVNRLTFQQREVIFHIIYHDLNYAETAAIMDLSKKSIYNLFSSAIISLRDKFKKDYSHKIQLSEIVILLTTYQILA